MFTLLVFVFVAGGGFIIYGQNLFNGPGPLTQDKVVFIPRNSGSADIATILEQEGVISSPLMFEISNLLAGRPNLKAGEYNFKQNASLKDVREVLSEGRSILHSLTIPEGLTSEQIVNRLKENDILVGEIRITPREGSLLPDTYRFGRGFSREQMIARMETEQKKVLQEIWQRRSPDIPVKSANDLVILASIVEKETGRSDERTRVASVFINRLNRGMRLESDPTIIYGLVGGKGSLGRGILSTEIRQPTPYNTYVINGLPPGPIANPGRAALEATANPSKTRDIFFVADGTGGHAFAETLEQHNRNVARWRQLEGGGSAPATPAAPVPRPGQRSDLTPPAFGRNSATIAPPPGSSAYVIPNVPLEFLVPGGGAAPSEGGENTPPALGNVESYPVAPGRRQTIQRGARQAGSGTGQVVQNDFEGAPLAEGALAPRRPKAFDASEGTSRDPLRNKSFDLNSPKTVPSLR